MAGGARRAQAVRMPCLPPTGPGPTPACLGAPRRGRSAGPAWALLAGLFTSLLGSACAVLPARGPAPAPAALTNPALVTVHGPGGPVSPAAENRSLAAVQAEGQPDLLRRQLAAQAAQGPVDLYRGNTAQLLVDGPATFAAMKPAIEAARHRVLVESYIFEDAGIAADIATLLLRRAAAGVQVSLVYDSLGSLGSSPAFFAQLAAGGVMVCEFNPVRPWQGLLPWNPNHRDHRKLVVVDDEQAFTGGINFSRVYASGSFGRRSDRDNPASRRGWRDTHIALRGPVVAALAQTFQRTWRAQRCPGTPADAPAAARPAPGQRLVQVLAASPDDGQHRIYRSLLAAIDASQRSVHLTMAYFAPGADMVQALADAARRGVDVVLVLPGRSDFAPVLHAGRAHYQALLVAGVQIHELQAALLHAKTAVIDGVYSLVGSSNMDWRSFDDNSELDVGVLGDDFGQAMEAMFGRDRAAAVAITPEAWARRGLGDRVREQLGALVERLL